MGKVLSVFLLVERRIDSEFSLGAKGRSFRISSRRREDSLFSEASSKDCLVKSRQAPPEALSGVKDAVLNAGLRRRVVGAKYLM